MKSSAALCCLALLTATTASAQTVPGTGTPALNVSNPESVKVIPGLALPKNAEDPKSPEEAALLLKQYQKKQVELIEERRAALKKTKGKTEKEKQQILHELHQAQELPLQQQRELGRKVREAEKLEQEINLAKRKGTKG